MRPSRLGLISTARRRQRLLAAVALAVGIAVVVVLVVNSGSPTSPAGSAQAATTSGATSVQRRNLVATDTESGTLSYSDPQTVYDRLSGTITWLPTVGQVVKPGGTLFKVDGHPVVLMDGGTPAFRDLTPAVSPGADVLELNRNLVRLGYNAAGITVDDTWQAGTTLGVDLLQESLGETETGSLTLGQVVFLPGTQLVSTVDATVGATGGGGTGSGGGTNASVSADQPRPQFVSLTSSTSSTSTTPTTGASTTGSSTTPPPATTPAPAPHRRHPAHRQPAPAHHASAPTGAASGQPLAALSNLLRAETQQLRAAARELRAAAGSASSEGGGTAPSQPAPSNSSHPSNASGGGGGNASAVLQTTSTRLVVTVDLAASSQSEATVGAHVTVELPDSTTVGGTITAVSPVAQSSSNNNNEGGGNGGGGSGNGNGGGGTSSTIPVTITLHGRHLGNGLDQAAVSVNFVQQRANHVLSVPVTALLATSGGNYEVQEATAPHRLIPVTTGLFAAGYVQISGPGISPGLQVTDSQG